MQTAVPHFGLRLTSIAAQCLAVAALSLSAFSARADDVGDVQKLLAAGKNVEALQKADQFLSSKPRDPMMRFLRGISLSQAGRTPEAITAFTKLTEDYPELPEPFNNLAVLYAQQGQYDKARNALEMAIRTNPSYATAYENLGDVYAKLASQAYSKALQIDTRSGPIFAKVWKMAVGRVNLFLLDSDVEVNKPEDRELTSRLYGGDNRRRIRQELVAGVGGVRALQLAHQRESRLRQLGSAQRQARRQLRRLRLLAQNPLRYRREVLNLKQLIYELDVPVIAGGVATYKGAMHLMRAGATGVLVGFGGGATHTTVDVLGVKVPMATVMTMPTPMMAAAAMMRQQVVDEAVAVTARRCRKPSLKRVKRQSSPTKSSRTSATPRR